MKKANGDIGPTYLGSFHDATVTLYQLLSLYLPH